MNMAPKRLLFVLAVLLAAFTTCGFVFERMTERAANRCPMLGQLVDVGGYKLHIYCQGQGSPAVVLAAGGIDSLRQWELVQPKIAMITRVCSFDAPGFGWSEHGPTVSFHQTAVDLHSLLTNALVPAPYVLVGHSNGGLVVQAFAHLYRDRVVGLVFDDSVNPEETVQFPHRFESASWQRCLGRLGVRLGLLGQVCHQTAACPDCVKFGDTLAQLGSHYNESESEVRYHDSYGNMPLFVLEHDPTVGLAGKRDEAFEKAWVEWQKEFATRSTTSKLEIASGVGHEIQTQKPQMVIDAVQWVLHRVETGPLNPASRTNVLLTIDVRSAVENNCSPRRSIIEPQTSPGILQSTTSVERNQGAFGLSRNMR
jgi:pimeloyl-ACP methyl ester carboxylesterase